MNQPENDRSLSTTTKKHLQDFTSSKRAQQSFLPFVVVYKYKYLASHDVFLIKRIWGLSWFGQYFIIGFHFVIFWNSLCKPIQDINDWRLRGWQEFHSAPLRE